MQPDNNLLQEEGPPRFTPSPHTIPAFTSQQSYTAGPTLTEGVPIDRPHALATVAGKSAGGMFM